MDAKLYYPALLVALTLPEICVTLAFPGKEIQVKESHYKKWVEDYVPPDNLGIDGLGCYRLRCGVVHRGDAAGHRYFGRKNVVFTIPESQSQIHGIEFVSGEDTNNAAMISLSSFVETMEHAVRRWHASKGLDTNVRKNLVNLLSWRPNGMPPYFVGAPVIASGPA